MTREEAIVEAERQIRMGSKAGRLEPLLVVDVEKFGGA